MAKYFSTSCSERVMAEGFSRDTLSALQFYRNHLFGMSLYSAVH
jgi:hypothetical protein